MEKKKLRLMEIQVNSFVTQSGEIAKTINGGNDTNGGGICVGWVASTVVTPTTLSLATVEITGGLTSIIAITTQTQGPNLQSDYAVACSRLHCQTYANLGFPCAAI